MMNLDKPIVNHNGLICLVFLSLYRLKPISDTG